MTRSRNRGPHFLLIAALVLGASGALWLLNEARVRQPVLPEAQSVVHSESTLARGQEQLSAPAIAEVAGGEQPLSPRTNADAQRLEILVVDPIGAPVARAAVALFVEQALIARATTDEEGIVRIEPREGEAEFALLAPGWLVQRGAIDCSVGRRSMTLLEGATVTGSVVIDGAVPLEPIELNLYVAELGKRVEALPSSVQKALGLEQNRERLLRTKTGSAGEFAFRGLPENVESRLQWPGPYFQAIDGLNRDRRQLRLPTPRRDVLLTLSTGFELRLRVVDVAGAPVPDGHVKIITRTGPEQGGSTSTHSTQADSLGRYSKVIPPEPPRSLNLTVALADDSGSSSLDLISRRNSAAIGTWVTWPASLCGKCSCACRTQRSRRSRVRGSRPGPLVANPTNAATLRVRSAWHSVTANAN